jgi:nucleotide-binding universal stress UspA family protein
MKRSLVVGVDDTDDNKNVLARAAGLARENGLRLVAVHVRHIPVLAQMSPAVIGLAEESLDLMEADARRAAEDVLPATGVDWEFVVRSGEPAHELMAVAEERSAAAIVVGGRPHRAAVSGLVRSVDAALVHRFRGSVLVVRGDESSRPAVEGDVAGAQPPGRARISTVTDSGDWSASTAIRIPRSS